MISVTLSGEVAAERRARLVTADVGTTVLPYLPSQRDVSGLADGWEQVPRPGAEPLQFRRSLAAATERLTFTVNGHGQSIASFLAEMKAHRRSRKTTQFFNGAAASAPSQVTELSWVFGEHFFTSSGEPTKADITIGLTEASAANVAVGPLPVRKKPTAKAAARMGRR